MSSENRAVEALTSLADDLADDPRVHKIVCEAIEKLLGRPCRPHWWRLPVVGDDALVCDECGRRVAFATMTEDIRSSIVNGFERRHGKEASTEFFSALCAVESARRPKVESKPDEWKAPPSRFPARVRVAHQTPAVNVKSELVPQEPSTVVRLKSELVPQEPSTVVRLKSELVPQEPSTVVRLKSELVPQEPLRITIKSELVPPKRR